MKAMTQTAGFKDRRDQATRELLRYLAEEVGYWTGSRPIGTQKFKPRFVDLAIDLHTSIICSRRSYQVSWPDLEEDPSSLRQWQLKDISTWISPGKADKDPIPVIAVVPGLRTQRSVQGRAEPLTLVKSTMVVCDAQKLIDGDESPRKSNPPRRQFLDDEDSKTTFTKLMDSFIGGRSEATSPASKTKKPHSTTSQTRHGKHHSRRPSGIRSEPRAIDARPRSTSSTPRPSGSTSRTGSASSPDMGGLDRLRDSDHVPPIFEDLQASASHTDGMRNTSFAASSRRRSSLASSSESSSHRSSTRAQVESNSSQVAYASVLHSKGLRPSQLG